MRLRGCSTGICGINFFAQSLIRDGVMHQLASDRLLLFCEQSPYHRGNVRLMEFYFKGYRILINLSRFGERTNPRSAQRHSTRRTDTNIQFTTNIHGTDRSTDQSESYELSSSSRGGRTFATSQISTLSLGK